MTPEKRIEKDLQAMRERQARMQQKLDDVNQEIEELKEHYRVLGSQAHGLEREIERINGAIKRLQTEGLPGPEEEDEDRPVWLDGQTTFVPISPK